MFHFKLKVTPVVFIERYYRILNYERWTTNIYIYLYMHVLLHRNTRTHTCVKITKNIQLAPINPLLPVFFPSLLRCLFNSFGQVKWVGECNIWSIPYTVALLSMRYKLNWCSWKQTRKKKLEISVVNRWWSLPQYALFFFYHLLMDKLIKRTSYVEKWMNDAKHTYSVDRRRKSESK